MADYYPLLARALDALPDRTPALRKAVYDRARNALISQLRSLDPPLSEADIDLERRALDAAIERLEVDHGGLPAPANDAAQAPGAPAPATVSAPPSAPAVPAPAAPEPAIPEPIVPAATEPEIPEPSPRSRDPVPRWRPSSRRRSCRSRWRPATGIGRPRTGRREAPIPIAPPRPGTPQTAAPDTAPLVAETSGAETSAPRCPPSRTLTPRRPRARAGVSVRGSRWSPRAPVGRACCATSSWAVSWLW